MCPGLGWEASRADHSYTLNAAVHDMQAIGEKALSMVLRKEEEGNEFRFGFHVSG